MLPDQIKSVPDCFPGIAYECFRIWKTSLKNLTALYSIINLENILNEKALFSYRNVEIKRLFLYVAQLKKFNRFVIVADSCTISKVLYLRWNN